MVYRFCCLRVLAMMGLMLAWGAFSASGAEPHRLRFLVMSPHTDDAEFGVGGLLVGLVREGHDVGIVNMTGDDHAKVLAAKTKQILGVQTVEWLEFSPLGVVETPDTRARVGKYLDAKRPDVILAPWPIDEHPDHRATGCLAIDFVNSRQQAYVDGEGKVHPNEYCPQLLFYEVMSGKQTKVFRADTFIDLPADVVEAKKKAMNAYNDGPYIAAAIRQAVTMLSFRGMEAGVGRMAQLEQGVWAEALVRFPLATGQTRVQLPGQK